MTDPIPGSIPDRLQGMDTNTIEYNTWLESLTPLPDSVTALEDGEDALIITPETTNIFIGTQHPDYTECPPADTDMQEQSIEPVIGLHTVLNSEDKRSACGGESIMGVHTVLDQLLDTIRSSFDIAIYSKFKDLRKLRPQDFQITSGCNIIFHIPMEGPESNTQKFFIKTTSCGILRFSGDIYVPDIPENYPEDIICLLDQPIALRSGYTIIFPVSPLLFLSGASDCPQNNLRAAWEEIYGNTIIHILKRIRVIEELSELGRFVDSYKTTREKSANEGIKREKAALKSASGAVSDINQRLIEITRKEQEQIHKLNSMINAHKEAYTHDNICSELRSIMNLIPGAFKRIDFIDEKIIAVTNSVILKHEYRNYEIGPMTISIFYGYGTGTRVKITGEYIVDGYPHPHVNTDGFPCLGNLQSTIGHMVAKEDWPGLLVTLSEFLKHYYSGNPYRPIDRWPYIGMEYDECRENNLDAYVCVECVEEPCPYKKDAYTRCYACSEGYTCLHCAVIDCEYHTLASSICIALGQAVKSSMCYGNCTHRSCSMYKNYVFCRETHLGLDCVGCVASDCVFVIPSEEEATYITSGGKLVEVVPSYIANRDTRHYLGYKRAEALAGTLLEQETF
jgi:hypothetical protein